MRVLDYQKPEPTGEPLSWRDAVAIAFGIIVGVLLAGLGVAITFGVTCVVSGYGGV